MEPLLTAAVALGTVVGTKILEKTVEKIVETLSNKAQQFLTNLNQESPDTVTAIVEHTPNQPLNHDQLIREIQAAGEKRPELRAQIEELAALGQQEPKLSPYIKDAVNSLIQSNPSVVNNSKLADEIKNLFQGNTFNNTTFN